jgi:hypothetical protein
MQQAKAEEPQGSHIWIFKRAKTARTYPCDLYFGEAIAN